jgi:hypothetical protein
MLLKERHTFLASALRAARSTGEALHMQAVTWLALQLLRHGDMNVVESKEDVTKQLLYLPAVPLDCAKQLMSGGMCVTYAQLLAAANSMVAGVEVWVQAQQQLGIQTDIPAAAVAICCGGEWVSGALSSPA